jgi:DNA repair photolyase
MFRPIYEPRTRAREYCDLAINIYTGCPHGCKYCYVPTVIRKPTAEFHSIVEPRPGIIEATKRQLGAADFKGKKIMLCFTCDPYPMGYDTKTMREIIKLIKSAGAHVQILTKGGMNASRDFDLLDSNDNFGVTITGKEATRKEYEPNAASNKDRLNALLLAKQNNIKTWLSAEPVFDFQVIYALIKGYDFIDMYRIGKLNHMELHVNWSAFGHECIRLCEEYGRNYYIKEDLRMMM